MRGSWPTPAVIVRCLATACAALACAALAGCAGGNPRTVGRDNVPLPGGTRILAHTRSCDRGAHAYCSIQLVVAGDRYSSSAALQTREQQRLKSLGWSSSQGDTEHEQVAESPGNELRLTYATAYEDLLAVDTGAIRRTSRIAHAMSGAVFDRLPAISLIMVRGAS